MPAPEEVKVRESLFSTDSSGCNNDDSGCGNAAGAGDAAGGFSRRRSTRDRQGRNQQGQRAEERVATSAAYIPASSSCHAPSAGWRGGRGRPWGSPFARKPRSWQRAVVSEPWTSPVAAHHLAAIQVRLYPYQEALQHNCICFG